MAFTTPPPLEPGSQVAVCRPAAAPADGAYPDHLVELGLDRLREEFGLDPVAYDSLTADTRELFENPEARAAELERAFRDPDVDGVVAAIGGNDQVRILPHLDADVLGEHPTRFYGTSDNTTVAAVLREQGVVSYYGGTLFTDVCEPGGIGAYTREYLERAFFDEALGEVRDPGRFSDEDLDWHDAANLERDPEYEASEGNRFHGEGRVEGRTWGGCLEVLNSHLALDRGLPDDTAGSVLLLETSEELPGPGEVWRTLMALGERGMLDVGAVLVGRAKARAFGTDRDADERAAYRERQREAVLEGVRAYNEEAVVVTDVPFGHARPVAPLPVGGEVVVDADAGTIRCP
ncbi:S66 peptidase family protein [Halorarius halobius]|uniref:S66 peptidase family protein n=1 Tax=Halorarius halobius TaxID=2962671 RepID=UPI0020CDF74E|nr:S66 peptidase family protein [Halorarius halobius]